MASAATPETPLNTLIEMVTNHLQDNGRDVANAEHFFVNIYKADKQLTKTAIQYALDNTFSSIVPTTPTLITSVEPGPESLDGLFASESELPAKTYPTTLHGWAQWCVERGWYVFPCQPRGKEPATKNGVLDASNDPIQVRAWWSENPDYNPAIALGPSNLVGYDFDSVAPFPDLPATLTVRSGRILKDGEAGGVHMYFRGSCRTHSIFAEPVPPITEKTALDKQGRKVIQHFDALDRLVGKHGVTVGEIRSRGAYLIAPGAIHKSGQQYKIINDVSLSESPEQNQEAVYEPMPAIGTDGQEKIAGYIEAAFDASKIDYSGRQSYQNGFKWLIDCPWSNEHSGGKSVREGGSSSAVFMLASGAISYVCKHAHCESTRQWEFDPTGEMDSLRGWMETQIGHKLTFQDSMPLYVNGLLIGSPEYFKRHQQTETEDYPDNEDSLSTMHDQIMAGIREGKTAEQIAEDSGFNKLVAESLAKVEADTVSASVEITDEILDREFPAYDGEDVGPIPTLIESFLPKGANFFGSLSGVGKTWLGLSVAKALTSGNPLFGIFSVKEKVAVLYLIPEASNATFKNRMKLMRICRDKKLFRYRTISQGVTLALKDPLTVRMIKNLRDNGRRQVLVIADTAIRFLNAKDENASTDNSLVSDSDYLRSKDIGADLLFMHHSPKASKKEAELTLENVLRGTGDFGAMADAVYGIRRDENLFAYGEGPEELDVVCVKPRDLENPPLPFRIILKRKPGKDDTKTRPISVIEETGDVVYVGPEAVKNKAGNLLDFTLRAEPYTSFNGLTKLLKMRRELVKDLAASRGWKQIPETVFLDGKPVKASNGQDKKKFRWSQITFSQPKDKPADQSTDSEPAEEKCLDSK
jgi:hypothetical protein